MNDIGFMRITSTDNDVPFTDIISSLVLICFMNFGICPESFNLSWNSCDISDFFLQLLQCEFGPKESACGSSMSK